MRQQKKMISIAELTEKWIGVAGREYRARIGKDFDEDVRDNRLRVYCDATPSTREILDITEAGRSEKPMARLCVVVPAHDVVIVQKFHHEYILKDGSPDNGKLESLSIEKAMEYCQSIRADTFSIYNDCEGAVARAIPMPDTCPGGRVRWIKRDFTPAGIILDRVTNRAGYLSRTKGRPRITNVEHDEIMRLMQAEEIQCTLTELHLWKTILLRKISNFDAISSRD